MAQPGWYPDPSGQPAQFRYWDGSQWSSETTADPASAPIPGSTPAAPEPPASEPAGAAGASAAPWGQEAQQPDPVAQDPQNPYAQSYEQSAAGSYNAGQSYEQAGAQQSYGQFGQAPGDPAAGASALGAPSGSGGGGSKTWLWIVAGLAALLLIGGIVAAGLALFSDDGDGDNSSTATESQEAEPSDAPSDEASEAPSEEPSEAPSQEPSSAPSSSATPAAACPVGNPTDGSARVANGRVSGGGISFPVPQGYKASEAGPAYSWAHAVAAVQRVTEPNWASVLAAGRLAKADGFTGAQQAAELVAKCTVTDSGLYRDVTSNKVLYSRATTIDGVKGWVVRREVRVDSAGVKAEGDVLDVVVLPLKSGDFAMYNASATIGNAKVISDIENAAKKITVE